MADNITNQLELQHVRQAITDAATSSASSASIHPVSDYVSSSAIRASSLISDETDYSCHQNDFVTHIQSLRHPGNQEICDTQTGDITVPASCPKNSAEYRAAYLSGIHPELNVYTPDGQYCQGTMFHHPGTESMTTTAGCQNPSYCLQGTGVTWNDTSVVHNYGTACIQFQCGGYVSPNTEWSFDGANNYTPGTTYICNFNSSNKLQTCVKCSGYYAAGSFAQTLPKGNVTASSMLSGYCAYNSAGTLVTGSIQYSKLYKLYDELDGSYPNYKFGVNWYPWNLSYSSGPSNGCCCCCTDMKKYFYASPVSPYTVELLASITKLKNGSVTYNTCICSVERCSPFTLNQVYTCYQITSSMSQVCLYAQGCNFPTIATGNTTDGGTPTVVCLRLHIWACMNLGTGIIQSTSCFPIFWSCYNIPTSP